MKKLLLIAVAGLGLLSAYNYYGFMYDLLESLTYIHTNILLQQTKSILLVLLGAFIAHIYSLYQLYSSRALFRDESDERRRIHAASALSERSPADIKILKSWVANSRGMLLYQQQLIPNNNNKSKNKAKILRGVVGICHGFGDNTTSMLMDVAIRFCREGFVVLTMDVEGHGLSDGVHGYIYDLKTTAKDYSDYFESQMALEPFKDLSLFIYGISMGGAIAFNLATLVNCNINKRVKGVILSAPMIRISEELKPPEFMTNFLIMISSIVPYAPITPTTDLIDKCFKKPEIAARARANQLAYHKQPRLQSAIAMLNAIDDIDKRMEELTVPCLIIHGDDDKVTCWKDSSLLHERAKSTDKTFKLYKDCYHELLLGGADEAQTEEIFSDITLWIRQRL